VTAVKASRILISCILKEKLLKGYKVGDMTYKVHLDGDNLVPYLTGQVAKSPRESFIYINDDQ